LREYACACSGAGRASRETTVKRAMARRITGY
jgi:hypothetical protein